jgi:hypothetical protein
MTEEEKIPLRIDLQEVFKNDVVCVFVNGEEIYHESGVTTKWSISLADSVEVLIPEGEVEVEVQLPLRDLSKDVVFFLAEPTYLGVRVLEDMIDIDVSNKRSLYR